MTTDMQNEPVKKFRIGAVTGTGSVKCPDTFTSHFSGRHGWRESCSSSAVHAYR